jgi:hypothetical protein
MTISFYRDTDLDPTNSSQDPGYVQPSAPASYGFLNKMKQRCIQAEARHITYDICREKTIINVSKHTIIEKREISCGITEPSDPYR